MNYWKPKRALPCRYVLHGWCGKRWLMTVIWISNILFVNVLLYNRVKKTQSSGQKTTKNPNK